MPDYRELDGGKVRSRMHNIHIDNRSRTSVTGVNDVESFNEQEIILQTEAGGLRIEGEGLHLTKLSLEEGQVVIEGAVEALEYEPVTEERRGLFSRMFK